MNESKKIIVEDPEARSEGDLTIAGICRQYAFAGAAGIPDQWQTFNGVLAAHPELARPVAYGVITGTDDGYEYLSGVALVEDTKPPRDLTTLRLPARQYLVFQHRGHVAGIAATCSAIWSDWLPKSGWRTLEAPWFEKYPERFDPVSGTGGVEIWIPVE